jgi:hypothetical protein
MGLGISVPLCLCIHMFLCVIYVCVCACMGTCHIKCRVTEPGCCSRAEVNTFFSNLKV